MKKMIYSVVAGLLFSSCSNFLDNKPKGFTIPEFYEDYTKLLASQSLANSVSYDGFYLTDDIKLLDRGATFADITYLNQSDHQRNLYSFKNGQIYTPGTHDYLWNKSYSRIYTYNTVINHVEDSEGGSKQAKKALRAEALFHRAFDYLYLVNIYGRHYDAQTAESDLGVPFIESEQINQTYTRQTVAQIYERIESDLKEAEGALLKESLNKFHPNLAALQSFYARIYLYKGEYDKALVAANKALEDNNDLLDLKEYIWEDGKTWGRVQLPDGTALLDKDDSPEAIYVRLQDQRKVVAMSDELRDCYKKDLVTDAVDQRYELFFAEDSVDMGRKDKFIGEACYILYAYQNVGFSTIENYLIAAECEARIGSKETAIAHLNAVRDARIIGNQPLAAANNQEALDLVLEERRREFAFLGFHRLIDLKRLNKEERYKKNVVHQADGQTYTLTPEDNRYIFPINQNILDFNNMPQYER